MSPTAMSQPTAAGIFEGGSMPRRIPTSMELHRILNQMLIRRYNLSAQYFGAPLEDVSPLPVEQSICFSDPTEGLLVVRGTRLFEKFLETEAQESFLELTVLFFHQFFLDAWKLDTRQLKAACFKSSAPVAWPDRKPDSSCTAFIKESPLEVRLWVPVSDEEMENWRAFRK